MCGFAGPLLLVDVRVCVQLSVAGCRFPDSGFRSVVGDSFEWRDECPDSSYDE